MSSSFSLFRDRTLLALKLPPQPEPPAGAPGSVRTFRAGKAFYKLRVLRWAFGQFTAALGIAFSLWFLSEIRATAERPRPAPVVSEAPATPLPPADQEQPTTESRAKAEIRKASEKRKRIASRDELAEEIGLSISPWVLTAITIAEFAGVAFFLCQLPFTFAMVRLEWEQHWYIVTDRSLRIRTGLVRLQESTMSFANLQQVEVKQGPLQRLLGLADVRVQSAGGGSSHGSQQHGELHDSLHTGVFHSVENAHEIRDLILERLRSFRQAGLGDPDDHHQVAVHAAPSRTVQSSALAAALEVLQEARALRGVLRS